MFRRTAFLALGLLTVLPSAFALERSGKAAVDNATVLHLSDSAERRVARDRLRAELRVEETGTDPRKVQAEINKRMAAALDRAKAVKSVRVETGGYSVYEDRSKTGGERWRGQQSIALIGTVFADVLTLSGELQKAGLVFSGMSFDLQPETARAIEDELTAEALARLRARAERVAAEMKLDVIRYREVRVGNVNREPIRPMMTMRADAGFEAAKAPVAQAGEQVVQLTVEADVLLGTARGP